VSRVTQKTIADKLGLSPSLVSRALSGKAEAIGSHPETSRRIIQTARAMGYVPSAAARHLRGSGGRVIGVVVADMGDPFFAQAMTEVIRQSHQRGCALTVAGFDRRIVDQRDISFLLEQELTGLLIIGGGSLSWMAASARQGINAVRIGTVQRAAPVHQIGPDEADGFSKLVRHLGSLGHRDIGFVGADLDVHRERLALAVTIARNAGMRCAKRHHAIGSDHVLKAGLEGGRRLIEQSGEKIPTALVCSSDTVAMGVLGALAEYGFRVPMDISVTGFDDVVLSQITSPPLTTLHQPLADMTRHALDILLDQKRSVSTLRLPLGLMQRGSTGKVP